MEADFYVFFFFFHRLLLLWRNYLWLTTTYYPLSQHWKSPPSCRSILLLKIISISALIHMRFEPARCISVWLLRGPTILRSSSSRETVDGSGGRMPTLLAKDPEEMSVNSKYFTILVKWHTMRRDGTNLVMFLNVNWCFKQAGYACSPFLLFKWIYINECTDGGRSQINKLGYIFTKKTRVRWSKGRYLSFNEVLWRLSILGRKQMFPSRWGDQWPSRNESQAKDHN